MGDLPAVTIAVRRRPNRPWGTRVCGGDVGEETNPTITFACGSSEHRALDDVADDVGVSFEDGNLPKIKVGMGNVRIIIGRSIPVDGRSCGEGGNPR